MQKYLYAVRRFKIKPWIKYYLLKDTKNVLPNTYQEVEYLEASGTQYIDTGVNGDCLVELDCQGTLKNTVSQIVIGSYTSRGSFFGQYSSTGKYGFVNTNEGLTNVNYDERAVFNIHFSSVQTSVTVNNQTYTVDVLDPNENNYALFRAMEKANKNYYYANAKIYSCKISKDSILVRNFIPCYRKSDNKPGMYDTVNNVFYTNEGDGEFIVGVTENALPNEYQEVEYLISDGYEYIDTGYAFTNPELKLEVKYRKTSTLGRNVFGVDLSQSPRKMHGNVFKNALYIGNSVVINDVPQELGVDYTLKFEFKNNVAKWNINGNEYTYNGANGWQGALDTETEYLFANRGAQTAQYLLIGRIYYVKFYDNNGDLVRNFVPCYRKLDDKPGMYDTVNNVFYTNEGDGEFNVGSEV